VEFFFPEQEHMKLFYLYTQRHVLSKYKMF
jgi:hypothetical protein